MKNQKIIISVLLLFFVIGIVQAATSSGTDGTRTWIAFQRGDVRRDAIAGKSADASGKQAYTMTIPGMWINRAVKQRFAAGGMTDDASQYDSVEVPGFSAIHAVGYPQLPLKTYMLEIPAGAQPEVQFVPTATETFADLNIVPAQEMPADVYPEPPSAPFAKNKIVYSENQLYPESNIVSVETVTMRDKHILIVQVAPLQVNPVTGGAVMVYDYELQIDTGVPVSMNGIGEEQSTDTTDLPVYMILTDDQYAGNATLSTLMDWKRKKGLDVRLVKTSQIDSGGAPSAAEIVAYMRALSDADYPDYLLIIGDANQTNGVAGTYFNTSTTDYYGYTDLDTACRTSSDYVPDLYYGRLPASSDAQVTTMLNKVLAMDRNPPVSDMYQKVVIAGQIQDSDDGDGEADRLFCETADSLACYFESGPSGVDYDCTRGVVNPDGMTATGTWNSQSLLWNGTEQIGSRVADTFVSVATAQSRISTNVNRGVALVQHRDHGYVNGVGWADPQYLSYSQVIALSNASNTPVVFSVNCNSGMYNFPNNFAKQWLIDSDGGAYGVFAPVDTSYSWYNDFMTHGFYVGFLGDYTTNHNTSVSPDWPKDIPEPGGAYGSAGSAQRLGQILNFGKMFMREHFYTNEDTFRLFHCFGDPESYLRIKTPQTVTVSHPATLIGTSHSLTVTVSQADSEVCLYSSSLGIHQKAVPSDGQAVFSFSNTSSGILNVTVTGPEVRSHESTISVALTSEPFVFRAFALTNSVCLRWIDPQLCGKQSSSVKLRAATDAYPVDADSGRSVYTGTDQVYFDTSIPNDVTQYYSIWVTDDEVNYVAP
ncbi:MAG: hypothetical protein EOL87_10340 [Spartobacteria bacterium]|nr:hypothetical protein [Spartobacteria bacterium]